MNTTNGKLSFWEKAGYSLSDASANFVFQMLIVFQLGFYTDVMGIKAGALVWMLLLVRFSDAITDPLMGIIADRTNTRWGKFRPWLLWSAIPFALLFWMSFTVPGGGDTFRLVYAICTYTLLMMAYTMNNVPYYSLNAVMTGDVSERTSVSAYRFFAAMAAAFVVQGLTLPLVTKLGGGDDAKGWSLTVGIYAITAILFFVITFFSVKERIRPPPAQKPNLEQDLSYMARNKAWVAMFMMTLFVFITLSFRGSSNYYYFTYFVDRGALSELLQKLGLVAAAAPLEAHGFGYKILDVFGLIVKEGSDPSRVGFGLFNMLGQLIQLIGVLLAKPLADRFGKKMVFTVGLAGATAVQVFYFFLSPQHVGTMFLLTTLSSLSYGPTIPLLWAMIADTVDWGEWKYGRRATGIASAGIVFALKAGLAFGGAFASWALAAYGYDREQTPTPTVLNGIRMMVSVFSALPFAISVLCMFFYPISKRLNLQMGAELAERRKQYVTQ